MDKPAGKALIKAAALVLVASLALGELSNRMLLHLRTSMIHESEQISLSAVAAFSETVNEWIHSNSIQSLERGTQIMLLGSSRYVQISYNGEMLIDGRAVDWEEVGLSPLSVLPNESRVQTVVIQNRLIIETVLPLRERSFTSGFVRVGTYSQSLESGLHRVNWLVAAIGALCWLVCLFLIGWLTIRHAQRSTHVENRETRRSIAPLREVLAPRPIVIDLRSRTIVAHGECQILTPKPFNLLALLLSDPSRVFSDQEIIEAIWPNRRYTSANDVHQCVYRLRRLLNEIDPDLGSCIANVKGFGYRFQLNQRVGVRGQEFERANSS